MSLISMLTF